MKYRNIYRMRHLVPFRVYESQTTSGLTKKQETFLNRYTQGTWSVNPTTGLVDIHGDFNFVNRRAKSFFGVKFGNVAGYFDCHGNQIRSLAGAPHKVGGHFDCSSNLIEYLEGAPQEVGGNFDCRFTQLQSLKGSPQKVDGNFNCTGNQLQSLEGAPQKVGGDFNCYSNQLQSLAGAPEEVNGKFDCSYNQLQSLEGGPKEVNGKFDCDHNQLQSLKGAPRKVNGFFSCSYNPLQSLEGAPKEINGCFYCVGFQLDLGEWNMEGWLEVLRIGNEKEKKLILTLPYLNPNFWNSKISENPESTILELSEFWDDMTDEVRNSIRIPSDLRDDFDNLLELVRAGIM